MAEPNDNTDLFMRMTMGGDWGRSMTLRTFLTIAQSGDLKRANEVYKKLSKHWTKDERTCFAIIIEEITTALTMDPQK